jgi:hypothetical protein
VAVLMLAVLHFAEDERARAAIAAFRDVMAPGSLLAISHSTTEGQPERGRQAVGAWRDATARLRSRGRAEVEALFDGFELVEPGVVWVPQWRPDGDGEGTRWMYAGVARR